MSKRLLSLVLLIFAAAFALSACGGSSDETGSVEEAIETSATTNDPADCKKLQTVHFMEQVSHISGDKAVSQCEEEAKKGETAEGATVSNVKINGSDANADVKLQGGSLNGQTIEVALVKEGDQWKLDKVIKFTGFDRKSLVEHFSEEFEKKSSGVSPKLASCLLGAFEKVPRHEIEELFISGSAKGFEEATEACASSSAG